MKALCVAGLRAGAAMTVLAASLLVSTSGQAQMVSQPEEATSASNPDDIIKFDHSIYLYCVVKYPTRVDEFSMPDFQNSIFQGISDHTLGNAGALYASAHGAKYLEKHFTLRKSFQYETEKAHLGSMDMQDLMDIKNTAFEFERIRKVLGHDK